MARATERDAGQEIPTSPTHRREIVADQIDEARPDSAQTFWDLLQWARQNREKIPMACSSKAVIDKTVHEHYEDGPRGIVVRV